jgi:ABC-2 type transport system ATP-binding protein
VTGAGRGAVEVRGLTRSFGSLVAVHPLDVTVGPGGITGLLGPNGAGKSTLMRMVLGLVPRGGGRCRLDGIELSGDGTALRRRATYAPGELAVYGEMNAREHLRWLLRGRERGALARATELADELGLPLRRGVRGFSHGMKRLLFVSAALAPDVPVRILDEPTEGLDPSRRRQVLELLQADAARGTTILLSSHHLGEVDHACERVLFMRDGKLIDEERTQALLEGARRALKLEWKSGVPTELPALLGGLGELSTHGDTAVLLLERPDVRPALAAIADLPAPATLSYGQLSLQDLYRELYGSEGV